MLASVLRAASYLDPELAQLAKAITILEGNGKPFGITRNQDVSAVRARPELKEELLAAGSALSKDKQRLSMEGIPFDLAMQALLEDKKLLLQKKGLPSNPDAVAEAWNTEKGLKKKTGKSYSEHLASVVSDIQEQFGNEEIRRLMAPLEKNPPLFPTLELLR